MVATAKDIRAQIRSEMDAVMKQQEQAALGLVKAFEAEAELREKLTEQLRVVEQQTADAAAHAVQVLGTKKTVALTGIAQADIKRLSKAGKTVDVTDG